jgi:large subunit ribosomal protein L21
MYAIFAHSGSQHRASVGDRLSLDKIDAPVGTSVTLGNVVLCQNGEAVSVGAPFLNGACLTAEVVSHAKGDKIIVFKKKRRHNYRRKHGHRQWHTVVKITDIAVA